MTGHQTATKLGKLQQRLRRTTDPLERQRIKDRITNIAHTVATAEYHDKADAIRRELAGAY